MAKTTRSATLQIAKYVRPVFMTFYSSIALSIESFPRPRPTPLRSPEKCADGRKNNGDRDKPSHNPPRQRPRSKPADASGLLSRNIRHEHASDDHQCWNEHHIDFEKQKDEGKEASDRHNNCEHGEYDAANDRRKVMKQFLEAEEIPGRLRRIWCMLGIGNPFEGCVDEERNKRENDNHDFKGNDFLHHEARKGHRHLFVAFLYPRSGASLYEGDTPWNFFRVRGNFCAKVFLHALPSRFLS